MSEEEKQISSNKRYNSILKIIDKHLVPDEVAKKDRGEVFTPPTLVREMLFGLRKSALEKGKNEIWGIDENGDFFDDKESDKVGGVPLDIWRDPNTKWLDPANGIGNFPVIAYYMLDYQLDENGKEAKYRGDKNKDKRRKHIIENMLYMIELDKGNCATSRSIFKKIDSEAKPNICCTNSLTLTDEKIKSKFGIDRFDVVMGNPPYQPSQLWEKFILKSLKNINNNGFISFVVPSSWTSYTSDAWKILNDYNIKIINSSKYLKEKYFPNVGSTFSYFLVEKSDKNNEKTTIINETTLFLMKLNKNILLPKIVSPISLSINEKVLTNNLDGKFIRKDRGGFKDDKSETYKYPYITFVKKDGNPDIKYLNEKDPNQDKNKVLLFRNGYINPYFDDGKNGVGDNIHSLIVNSEREGKNIVKLFKSELYKYIWDINKHSAYNHGGLMDMVFRDVKAWDNFDDNTIYEKLKIVEKEQQFINTYLNTKKKRGTHKTKEAKPKGGAKKPKNKTRKVKKFFGLF